MLTTEKRLMGASLLVFANKTDIDDCMTDSEIQQVSDDGSCGPTKDKRIYSELINSGASTGRNQDAQMDYCSL